MSALGTPHQILPHLTSTFHTQVITCCWHASAVQAHTHHTFSSSQPSPVPTMLSKQKQGHPTLMQSATDTVPTRHSSVTTHCASIGRGTS
eukprot:1012646-Pelagomonas_calceolata.AAC.2